MAKRTQPAQTAAPPEITIQPPEAPTPSPISDILTIKRVDNGFVLEASLADQGFRWISKRVAPGAAALQTEVAAWVNPAPKKR